MLREVNVNETVELLAMSDGFKLFARRWAPLGEAVKTVVCIHGLGGCSGCFKRVGVSLATKGMDVWGFDLRGFGNSKEADVPRGDTKNFGRHLQDIDEAIQAIRGVSNCPKLFLLGHSLGGLYVLWYGATYPEAVNGLVLAAPSVENKPIMSPEEQAKFSLAVRSAPETMLKTRKNSLVSVSKEFEEYLPVTRSFSVRYFMGIGNFLMRDRMFVNASNARKHTLILQGDADEYALPIGAKRLFESIAAEDKRLEIIRGAKHTLYGAILSFASDENNLKGQEFVLSLIGDWIGSH
jgi:alpha-beta hydrolase superfamily lysophospholipase